MTEFLPVSSSGHLVLFQHFMQTRQGDVFFDIVLHVGTLGSVLVVYRREVLRLLRFDGASLQYILSLVVGTLPAVAVGLLAKDKIEALFHSPVFAAAGLLYTAALLLSTRFSSKSAESLPEPWQPRFIMPHKALVIGLFQAVAIMPGVSRSGSTIAASLWLGLPRAEAARFSFLLSIPAIGGALVLQLADGAGAARGDFLPLVLAPPGRIRCGVAGHSLDGPGRGPGAFLEIQLLLPGGGCPGPGHSHLTGPGRSEGGGSAGNGYGHDALQGVHHAFLVEGLDDEVPGAGLDGGQHLFLLTQGR